MFHLAITLGIYSYLIFFLGIEALLFKEVVITVTIVFLLACFIFFRKKLMHSLTIVSSELRTIRESKLSIVLLALFTIQLLVNIIGALGPELAFDALWYHLTLPKYYLTYHAIEYIPGGLLYYSAMPKLGEMLYVGMLALGNETTVKLLHLFFGILSAVVIYIISRKFFTPYISLIALAIFYANLVVAWESTTAYIDLIRTFFEIMAVWALINWWQTLKDKWLLLCSIMIGLAITTKLLAISTFIILLVLIIFVAIRQKQNIGSILRQISLFSFVVFLIPIPWFIFATIHTGNPVYPFFTSTYGIDPTTPNPIQFFTDVWNIFIFSADPISPVYIIILPLIVLLFTKMRTEIKLLIAFACMSIVMWYFTPRTGGGRFLMPYLPVFSIICAAVLDYIIKKRNEFTPMLAKYIIGIIILIAVTTIGYRALASLKYIPVITGQQSKQAFLTNNLNFSFGDFYDIDGFFSRTITEKDTVLMIGFHNLYYVEFPFEHISWIKKGETYNYIAVQNAELPERFRSWKLIYENKTTNVKLYSDGGIEWKY
jgi:4-amino-4-deoxy-L-arabinose transferase-like glycosyltransferase